MHICHVACVTCLAPVSPVWVNSVSPSTTRIVRCVWRSISKNMDPTPRQHISTCVRYCHSWGGEHMHEMLVCMHGTRVCDGMRASCSKHVLRLVSHVPPSDTRLLSSTPNAHSRVSTSRCNNSTHSRNTTSWNYMHRWQHDGRYRRNWRCVCDVCAPCVCMCVPCMLVCV